METYNTQELPQRFKNNRNGSSQDKALGYLYTKYRSEKSYHGYDPSVLKSGIQKYARRAEVEKGLWCLIEMDLFSLLEWDSSALDEYLRKYPEESRENIKTQAMRLRTNMVNRLVVMMTEEVNISAWWMPARILNLYEKWIENRNNASSRKYLVDMYQYLTSQKMIRLISDLKSVYLLPPDYVKRKHMANLTQIHGKIQNLFPGLYSGRAEVGEVDWDSGLDEYPASLHPCIRGIAYNFENASDHVFFWIKKLCDFEKKDGVAKYRYIKIVWGILNRFIDRHREYEFIRETVSALEFFFNKMGHREKPIYLYHAVLLMVRRNEIDWSSKDPGIDTSVAEVDFLYSDHLNGGKMPMDDYILDLHTHRGKRGANCLENFALEGAYIKNENIKFLRPAYRGIYVLLKQELDFFNNNGFQLQQKRWPLQELSHQVGIPIKAMPANTMAKINNAPQAQKRTAKFKKAVLIVEDLIFKGPYKCDDPGLMNSLRFTYAVQLLEEALHLPEWQRGALPWEYIGQWGSDQYYLAAPNVGRWKNIPFKQVSSKIESNVSVIPRCGAVWRVSDVEKNGRLTNGIKLAALQHLYFRFLLGIGDSGTHNVLVREDFDSSGRLIAGIDPEERRGDKETKRRLNLLFSKLHKKHIDLYESDICKIKSLTYSELDQHTLDRVSGVGIDLEKLKENMELWEILN